MDNKKLFKKLDKNLDRVEIGDEEHCDHIDKLLGKIKKQEKKLRSKLEKEKNSVARKHIKTELKIVALQLKRGSARRKELSKKCGK